MLSKKTPLQPSVDKKPTHTKTVTSFSFIVLVVIIVTFVGAPVVSQFAGESTIQFGAYDGVPIEYSNENYFGQQVDYYDQYFNKFSGLDVEQKRRLVWNQAFQQAAIRTALKREAEKAGIIVTEKRIDAILVKHPAYQKNGRYSHEAYLNTSTIDRHRYRQNARDDEMIQQYVDDYSGVLISKEEMGFISRMKYPQRQLLFVVFTESDYPESLVRDYAQNHRQLFRTIELGRITIKSSEGEANKIREEILNGVRTFEEAAKAISKDALADSGGALSARYYYELKEEFNDNERLDQVFGMTKGDISPVFERAGTKEWVFYKIMKASEAANLSEAATISMVRSYINRYERSLVEDYLKDKAQTLKTISTERTFSSEAMKLGKVAQRTQFFPVNFGDFEGLSKLSEASSDPIFQKLANNEDFFKKVFHTPQGVIADPFLVSSSVLLFKVDAVKQAPTLADKQEEEEGQLQKIFSQEREEALRDSLLSSPQFKNSFDKVMKDLGDF